MSEDTLVAVAAWATIAVVIVALLARRPCAEAFTKPLKQLKADYTKELKGRKVAKVASLPSKRELDTVYFKVVGNRLVHDPWLPYEGLPVDAVVREYQRRVGVQNVAADTQNVKHPDRITVVYNPQTRLATKVHIPRRWSMPPAKLDLVGRSLPPLDVVINPPAGTQFKTKTLVITTDRDNRAISAVVRG